MIDTIKLYNSQRVSIKIFIPLSLYLIFYGYGTFSLISSNWKSVLSLFPLVFLTLVFFRVFDDLASRTEDQEKPNRVYTQPSKTKDLYTYALFITIMIVGYIFFIQKESIVWLSLVYITGLFPYIFKKKLKKLSFIVPLIKYPLIVFFVLCYIGNTITIEIIFSLIALLLVFVMYEIIEDKEIQVSYQSLYIIFWIVIIFFGLCIEYYTNWIYLFSIALLFFISCIVRRVQYLHYIMLLFILLLRIGVCEL